MSFPEIPLFVYPSHARKYGVEEALLYSLCCQCLYTPQVNAGRLVESAKKTAQSNVNEVEILKEQWDSLTSIWQRDKLSQLIASLAEQQALRIHILDKSVVISEKIESNETELKDNSKVDRVMSGFAPNIQDRKNSAAFSTAEDLTQVLPVYDVPPVPAPIPLPKRQQEEVTPQPFSNSQGMLKGRGPAPSFGGSTGWKKRSGDSLQTLFAQQEVLNKQLHPMTMNWKPSAMFYSTLHRSGIAKEVSDNCLDEFILFYCDKNTKERSWDQKFLAWVKRDWVKQQTKDNRVNTQQQSGPKNENSQRDTREKRKRITAAIMDIHDTNW